ncbi:hypothetical protein ACMZ5S_07430 [Streptococcus pluranimalium]
MENIITEYDNALYINNYRVPYIVENSIKVDNVNNEVSLTVAVSEYRKIRGTKEPVKIYKFNDDLQRKNDMNEQKEFEYDFLGVLGIMLVNIQEDYSENKDPLTRCELAKGYLAIGRYLYENGALPIEILGESITKSTTY